MEPVNSLPIYVEIADRGADVAVAREDGDCSHVGSVEVEQSVMGIVQAIAGCREQEDDGQADSAVSTGKMDPQSPGWTKRYVFGNGKQWPVCKKCIGIGKRKYESAWQHNEASLQMWC